VTGSPGHTLEAPPLFLDITVTEPPPHRDPLHVYTLRLRAAPRARMVPYDLVTMGVSASTFIDDCPPCARVTVPVSGTGGATSPARRSGEDPRASAQGCAPWQGAIPARGYDLVKGQEDLPAADIIVRRRGEVRAPDLDLIESHEPALLVDERPRGRPGDAAGPLL